MTPENYYRERSAIICKMRVEEKKTLQAIADLFDIGSGKSTPDHSQG
jgi:hypothetical protein